MMNRERIKLIIKNMELLVEALKEEIKEPVKESESILYDDYDEIYEEE